jgi:hypothetical protein
MTVKAACLLGILWKLDHSAVLGLLSPSGQVIKAGSSHIISTPDVFNGPGVWKLMHPNRGRPCFFAVTGQPSPFRSDFATYTSRPHARPPSLNPLTFWDGLVSHGDSGGNNDEVGPWSRRSIVLCTTGDEMASLKLLLANLLPAPWTQQSNHDAPFAARFVMTGIEHCALKNIDLISAHLEEMRYVSRNSPSYQKLNHVLHLQDHLQDIMRRTKPPVIDEIKTKKSVLAELNPDDLSDTVTAWVSSHITLMSQTHNTAKEALDESKAIYAMIQDQLAGKDSSRNRLFAILAAIYLPFTLASGILGMNIRQYSTYDNPNNPNSTADPKAPSWQVLIYIGLPLTVITIALPLSFDMLRASFRALLLNGPGPSKRSCGLDSFPSLLLLLSLLVLLWHLHTINSSALLFGLKVDVFPGEERPCCWSQKGTKDVHWEE